MNKSIRKLAMILALILAVTSVPYTAKAAAAPDFKTYRTDLYENTAANGVYTYTVTNVKKGYQVKWSLSGTGKAYGKLKYAQTTAKGATSSNKITINSNKETAAKNKKITITAKVYDTKGKLVKTLNDEVTIKIQATAINIKTTKIKDDLNSLSVGKAYDFDKTFTPANSTSKTYWTVNDESGKDRSSEIPTSEGIWTPTTTGKYTITATARNSKNGKVLASKSITVNVGVSITDLKQTAANQFRVIFSTDMRNTISADDFTIAAVNGTSTIAAKEVSCSATGKVVTVTNYSNFKDGVSYNITYGNVTKAFIASVGAPKSIKILTETVEAGKATEIEYGIYDSKDIDVKAAVSGKVSFAESSVTNGYVADDDKIYMTTPGKTATIVAVYTDERDNTLRATKTVTCVEPKATEVSKANFTITGSKSKPDFDSSSYKENTTVAIGDTAYAHFRAVDEKKKEISYSSVAYASSDDDKLIVDSDGKLTPIKTGTVKVLVTAVEDGKEASFAYTVTVIAKRVPSYAKLSTYSVTMSNAYVTDYEEYIGVEIFDQNSVSLNMENALCTIKENGNKAVLASYDEANRRIVVKAHGVAEGTYNYTATFVLSGTTLTANFAVVVKAVPNSGSYGYTAVSDCPVFDMVIDGSTTGDKNITVRLKQMINGIFSSYAGFTSATIRKDGLYYGNDLTAGGSKSEVGAIITNGTDIVLTPLKITAEGSSVGESKKAEPGIYTITIKYYNSSGNLVTAGINITLKDSQSVPSYTIKSTTSSKTVNTALALVNDCITFSDGTVYNCTVTGSSLEGDAISVTAGQKINIATVSVRNVVDIGGGKRVYVYYTINIGKTLTNK